MRGLVAGGRPGRLFGWGVYEVTGTLKAHALRDRLLDANTHEVPAIVAEHGSVSPLARPAAASRCQKAEPENDRCKQLHASLALLPVDPCQVDYLYGWLLDAEPHEVAVIRDALAPHKEQLVDRCGPWWKRRKRQGTQRLRAAAALAKYDPAERAVGEGRRTAVANDLVGVPAVYLGLVDGGACVPCEKLLPALAADFRDSTDGRNGACLATSILADYAGDQPQVLADLLMDADDKQFAVIYPKFKEQCEGGLPILTGELSKELFSVTTESAKEKLAKRQSNAAVALLRLNQPNKGLAAAPAQP